MNEWKVKLFADGADLSSIKNLAKNSKVAGFTTNPSLMRKAGVTDYREFAERVLEVVPILPVSFEVFSDDLRGMERQALEIASWGQNVRVKIPVTNSQGLSTAPLISSLTGQGVSLNVTAVFTAEQVTEIVRAMHKESSSIVSVFAGRIADTGRNPLEVMRSCLDLLKERPNAELLWASSREVYNIIEANEIGCHIITISHDLFAKMELFGKDLNEYSLETVKDFYQDALSSGFAI